MVTAVSLAACARAPTIEVTPPGELDGFRAAPAVELDAERVAADATDAEVLASLLEDTGFQRAVERPYTGLRPDIRRVVVRVVRFATPEGAERYLSWLRAHPDEVIGEVADTRTGPGGGPIFIHEPGGCCPKELPLAMGTWRSGREVVRVIVAGPAADEGPGIALLARVHELTTRAA